ncbi:MAG: hypothetical protein EOM74_03455 [Methanomicrobia archaeon]|nr:hypothetical protein [Methanomicrobia archaeon]
MMKNKHTVQMIILIIIFVVITIVVAQNFKEFWAEIVTAATALFGVVSILYQLQKDHKIKKAEFIYSLINTFNENKHIVEIYTKLKMNRDKPYTFNDDEGRMMGDYVMFFDVMQHLLEQNMVDIALIDRMFANKFFLFCNHKDTQKYQLQYTMIQEPFIDLYVVWYNYRTKHNLPELYPECSFSRYKDFFIKNDKGLIKFNPDRRGIAYTKPRENEC